MHGMMCHALSTYATYATPAEKREIDELISPWSYYTTRQRCAKGGM
jgi:hypothetical protein